MVLAERYVFSPSNSHSLALIRDVARTSGGLSPPMKVSVTREAHFLTSRSPRNIRACWIVVMRVRRLKKAELM